VISVVLPALDEEDMVAAAIGSVREEAGEVIVSDGGSSDRTRERAREAGATVLDTPPGRGAQLRHGAAAARGDWLVFLHADTRLDPGWSHALLAVPSASPGGAFRFAIDSPRRAFRVIEWGTRQRCRFLRLPYGDQALFARRGAYDASGGFRPLPLMEDVDFVRRLRRQGPLALLEARALTSPRRWEETGLLRRTLTNWSVMALYTLGASPERLARVYSRRSKKTVSEP
jgi:rSAM/selenodomain-associated transferase 2